MRDSSNYTRAHLQGMQGYTPGEQSNAPGLIKLNTNENPYPPSPKVAAALQEFSTDRLRLYPNPVSSPLRKAIASYHRCSEENVFVGNGSDEVLALLIRSFVEEGAGIGWFDPSYSLYPILADIHNAVHCPVPLTDGYEWVDPEENPSSLFFITQPNAPTGMLHDKQRIRSFCERYPGVVVVDEAYIDFADEDCVDLAISLPNVIVSRSFSKSFSLAGIRLGYALGSPELISTMVSIKDSYNVDMLTQHLGLAAINDLPYMRSNVARIRATREAFVQSLQNAGFHVYPSAANFVWVTPPGACAAKDLYAHLRESNILTRYFPGDRTGSCLRITIGTDEHMAACLRAIETF